MEQILPQSLQREHSLADTLILDLTATGSISVILSHKAGRTLLHWPQETNTGDTTGLWKS